MLYTIDFEYRGGTYLSQVQAADPSEAFAIWLERISDEEINGWNTSRAALLRAFNDGEAPVPIEGLVGVWCLSRSIGGDLALTNIIATAKLEAPVSMSLSGPK